MLKLQSVNPHDQSIVGELKISTLKEIQQAVAKAQKTFETWKFIPLKKRAIYLTKFNTLLQKNKKEIAQLITKEMGKPISESMEDIEFEQNFINYYTTEGPKQLADQIVLENKIGTYRIVHEPYGVAGIISPWNFPVSMATSGILPAILAGNTIVFKPSEHTSLTQKLITELLWETKLPDGVVNLIIGDGQIGKILMNQPIDLIWFTGSTKVGQQIYQKAAQEFIPAILEMGGSSPAIVFADANLDKTVNQLISARFYNCGQVCSAIKRTFVQKPIYEKFIQKFTNKIKQLKIGNPMDKVDIGPLVSQKQLRKLKAQLRDAQTKGATILTGGQEPNNPKLKNGYYFLPTVVTNVSFNTRIMEEETFGPILPIVSFETEKQAIEYANKTPYGLTAEIYTQDKQKAERVATRIQAGTIGINTDEIFYPQCPFGGYKLSGIGREYGAIGFHEFTQTKTIAVAK